MALVDVVLVVGLPIAAFAVTSAVIQQVTAEVKAALGGGTVAGILAFLIVTLARL